MRKKYARKKKIRSENVVEIGDLSDEESDPLLHCIAHSEKENLWVSARRVLNDDVFAATWLRYAEDMSISDISKALDRSDRRYVDKRHLKSTGSL